MQTPALLISEFISPVAIFTGVCIPPALAHSFGSRSFFLAHSVSYATLLLLLRCAYFHPILLFGHVNQFLDFHSFPTL